MPRGERERWYFAAKRQAIENYTTPHNVASLLDSSGIRFLSPGVSVHGRDTLRADEVGGARFRDTMTTWSFRRARSIDAALEAARWNARKGRANVIVFEGAGGYGVLF